MDAANLLTRYGFDLSGYTAEQLVNRWQPYYPSLWLRAAVIEALYQGRYKAVSVEQILSLWQRRGHPVYHFNHEFERIVCNRFPKKLNAPESESDLPHQSLPIHADRPTTEEDCDRPLLPSSLNAPDSVPAITAEPREDVAAPPESIPLAADASALLSSQPATLEPNLADTSIPTFKPSSNDPYESTELLNWSKQQTAKHPIHQFVPAPTASEFYDKLKAVAQRKETSANASSD